MIDEFEERIDEIEQYEEELFREVIEAANYVSEHSMMHYGGRYDTTELLLNNEQAEKRLENSITDITHVKALLEKEIHELELKTMEIGSEPRYVEKTVEKAQESIEDLENEIQHIKQARERPPEEKTDQGYVEDKDTEAQTLADSIKYTPKREET